MNRYEDEEAELQELKARLMALNLGAIRSIWHQGRYEKWVPDGTVDLSLKEDIIDEMLFGGDAFLDVVEKLEPMIPFYERRMKSVMRQRRHLTRLKRKR
jgi:hypothetical protein